MPRQYTNGDIHRFSHPLCRPGDRGYGGYIGIVFKCTPGDVEPLEPPPPHLTLLRTWYWLDEDSGLLGQTNVTSAPLRPDFLPRDGEPGHFQKKFEWPWPHMTPARLKDPVHVRRETADDHAPDTFSAYPATVGAYVFSAGTEGGINTYLGLPGAGEEARKTVPDRAVPEAGKPWPLELFIKDGAGCRWAAVPYYDTATGALQHCWLTKERLTDADPATPLVLELLRPTVPPPRSALPGDPGAWGLPAGSPGSALRTWVGERGEVLTEDGLEAKWSPPGQGSLTPGHTLLCMADQTYLVCPRNNIHLTGGPLVFEFGGRRVDGGRGFQRVTVRFSQVGLFQEVRYEEYP